MAPTEAPSAPPTLYSRGSLDAADEIGRAVARALKRSAVAAARRDGRSLVTAEDVRAAADRLDLAAILREHAPPVGDD